MMTSVPLVSVILPAFNASKYIAESIDSVLAQSFRDFELLVIDNGSVDSTVEIVGRFRDKRLRLLRHKSNRGLSNSLNHGILMAKGVWLARVDADDVCLAERFEKQLAFLEKNKEVVAIGTAMIQIDDRGRRLSTVIFAEDHQEIVGGLVFGKKAGQLAHSSVMVSRRVVEEVGGYPTYFSTTEDLPLWLRLTFKGRLANLPDPLILYRVHQSSMSLVKGGRPLLTNALASRLAYLFRINGLGDPLEDVLTRKVLLDCVSRAVMNSNAPMVSLARRNVKFVLDSLLNGWLPSLDLVGRLPTDLFLLLRHGLHDGGYPMRRLLFDLVNMFKLRVPERFPPELAWA